MAEISKITLPDNSTYYIRDRHYTICETAAATVEKTASLTGFTLVTGAVVDIKFTYSNTASDPTLNINSTGAKLIKRYGTTAPGTTEKTSWYAGSVITLVYDGNYWIMANYQYTKNIEISETQPTGGQTGDIWLVLVDE